MKMYPTYKSAEYLNDPGLISKRPQETIGPRRRNQQVRLHSHIRIWFHAQLLSTDSVMVATAQFRQSKVIICSKGYRGGSSNSDERILKIN